MRSAARNLTRDTENNLEENVCDLKSETIIGGFGKEIHFESFYVFDLTKLSTEIMLRDTNPLHLYATVREVANTEENRRNRFVVLFRLTMMPNPC